MNEFIIQWFGWDMTVAQWGDGGLRLLPWGAVLVLLLIGLLSPSINIRK